MYKKAMGLLIGVYMVLFMGLLCAMGTAAGKGEREMPAEEMGGVSARRDHVGISEYSSSDRRVVDFLLLEKADWDFGEIETMPEFSAAEIEVLQRIVEAEAGGEDDDGKLLVANVVLNRVRSEQFPNTISEVVFQRSNGVTQFSPVANGRYGEVTVSEETKSAVDRALQGEDISEGALYFAARKYANQKSMKWFDDHLTLLFKHGGHEFFK